AGVLDDPAEDFFNGVLHVLGHIRLSSRFGSSTPGGVQETSPSGLGCDLGRHWLGGLLHQVALDVSAVLRKLRRDLGLVDAVQITDAPVELLQSILCCLSVALALVGPVLRHCLCSLVLAFLSVKQLPVMGADIATLVPLEHPSRTMTP